MYRALPIFGVTLASSLLSQAEAADVCLRPMRIYSWAAVDQRTMVVVDRDKKHHVIAFTGPCIGLDNSKFVISILTPTQLGCITGGEQVAFRDPALGEQRCTIASVKPIEIPQVPD
jgi:hypothetical protein